MLYKKEKAQGLVEFALILPFLLLALLAIVEAARIIWAYTTVQTAAREAARYAVTGKPYAPAGYVPPAPPGANFCAEPQGDPSSTTPWNCNADQLVNYRVQAIKKVAKERISTMALTEPTCNTEEEFYTFRDANPAECTRKPGTYGILVVGQRISSTVSLTTPIEVMEYPGTQGLNVEVTVFYNVEMFDPILDTIVDAMMGRPDSYVQVSGRLAMQNEGIDPSLGAVPPPAIGSSTLYTNNNADQFGPNGEQIWSKSGYTVNQNEFLTVHLENHLTQGGPYDIYLGSYKICASKNTNVQNNGDYDCLIDSTIPPGLYDLFSTRENQYPNRLVTAPQKVEVRMNAIPSIVVKNGDVFAANSFIQIELVSHDPAKQPFQLYFVNGLGVAQLITPVNDVTSPVSPWKIPDGDHQCPVGSATPCRIESRSSSDSYTTTYAFTNIFVNAPQIRLAGNETQFTQGDTIYISLSGHSPGKQYDIQISDGGGNTYYIGRTELTNSLGDTVAPIPWTVFEPGAMAPWSSGWPDGTYDITSHEVSGAPNMTDTNWVARKQITIDTPDGPFLTVDGGYTWPINSIITIKVHNHPQAGNPYFLNFGPFRVLVVGASPSNTFEVGSSLSAAQNYTIPPEAVTNGQDTVQTIASYENNVPSTIVAQRDVTVTPVPIITVLEGDRALPNATITISLTNHIPNSTYQIAYAGVTLLEGSNQAFTIQTDSAGKGQRVYNLLTLPPGHPAASPVNYGIAFVLNSQLAIAPATMVATTTLMIDSADLKITQVQLPTSAIINTAIPMVVTVQNTKPITINRYFDVDLYADPSPVVPAYKENNFNFPGDVKLWKAPSVAPYGQPGDTFTMTQSFTLTTYGTHVFYGYADTSNFIFNETSEVNNVLSNTITVNCNYSFINDNFANLNAWTTKIYNTANTANASSYPKASGNHLLMSNDGLSTTGPNDDASTRGHVLLYRTQPITTEPGLDVRVQVINAPNTANFASAGLQVRANPASATSAKVEFSLGWDTSNSKYRLQHLYRTSSGTLGDNSPGGTISNLNTNPVWLRIKREPASDVFTFYYAQQAAAPTDVQWLVFDSVTVPISPTVYVGLFNASYKDGTNGTAEFANFSVSNTATCPTPQGETTPPTPPGFTVCSDPLLNKSFETVSNWVLAGGQFVSYGPGGRTGSRQLLAHSFNGGYRTPNFSQQFTMPASLLATTTLKFDFYYNLNNLGDGDDANDKYYAVVVTSTSPLTGFLTNPTEILNGDVPPVGSSAPVNFTTGWTQKSVTLPLANGVNLENYEGKPLYLYVYNNSNTGCTPGVNCHASEFYFDDVNLSVCTGEPLPTSPSTALSGVIWLHQSGAAPQKVAGVKVWAYAENGTLYKTFTIQDGRFNFFNIPAGSYFIYAEYFITDPNDPSQLQQLAADITVDLRTTVNTRLDLFPVY